MAWRRNARRAQAPGTEAPMAQATESWTEWVDRLAEDLDGDAYDVEAIAENAGSERNRDELEALVREAMGGGEGAAHEDTPPEAGPIVVGSE